jgi:poly [ADP-ribose] polymerase
MSVRVPCSYQVKSSAAIRLQPWYYEEPTEEETEDMKTITEKHVANAGGGSGKAGDIPSDLIEAVKNLDWPDISSLAGKKEAAKLMVEICRTAIDIPDDEKKATMGIGKIIVNNPDASANEILEHVVKEYGIMELKKAASATQKDAMATSCKCAANAPIVQVLKELGELYFKEGNSNAGATVSSSLRFQSWNMSNILLTAFHPSFCFAVHEGSKCYHGSEL